MPRTGSDPSSVSAEPVFIETLKFSCPARALELATTGREQLCGGQQH